MTITLSATAAGAAASVSEAWLDTNALEIFSASASSSDDGDVGRPMMMVTVRAAVVVGWEGAVGQV